MHGILWMYTFEQSVQYTVVYCDILWYTVICTVYCGCTRSNNLSTCTRSSLLYSSLTPRLLLSLANYLYNFWFKYFEHTWSCKLYSKRPCKQQTLGQPTLDFSTIWFSTMSQPQTFRRQMSGIHSNRLTYIVVYTLLAARWQWDINFNDIKWQIEKYTTIPNETEVPVFHIIFCGCENAVWE